MSQLTRTDRCQCGKLEEQHFIIYWRGLPLQIPGNCEDTDDLVTRFTSKRYKEMRPLELSIWIEEQYDKQRLA